MIRDTCWRPYLRGFTRVTSRGSSGVELQGAPLRLRCSSEMLKHICERGAFALNHRAGRWERQWQERRLWVPLCCWWDVTKDVKPGREK